jgi:hypothetical protein
MIDYFALLKQQRRPWLDPNGLKDVFQALSGDLHPDRVHGAGPVEKRHAQEVYAELNAAYQCLREPKDRLRHLLELERGAKLEQVQCIPSPLMDVSLEVGQACRTADRFLVEKGKATSPLLQVDLFERGQERAQELTALAKQLESRRELLITELMQVDSNWMRGSVTDPAERKGQLARLEEIYRLLSYYERWTNHLRERIVQLSL